MSPRTRRRQTSINYDASPGCSSIDERSDAHLVVSRNLGSDSLQRWLAATFERGYSVHRVATGRGFRVIKVRRRGAAATGVIPLP